MASTSSFLKGILKCGFCDSLMKPTVTIKHGLRYRYYTCYKHLKYKTCESPYKNAPAEPIERTVIDEILKILKSPEVVLNLSRLAEEKQEISKDDLMLALKNLNEAWDYLYAAEQRKIVRLLVNSVEIQEKGVKLNMNLDGFDRMFVELAT